MLVSALRTSILLRAREILNTSSKGGRCGFASVLVPPTQRRKATELKINALQQMNSAGNT